MITQVGMCRPLTMRLAWLPLVFAAAEASRVQLPYHAQSPVKEFGKCAINASEVVGRQMDRFPMPTIEDLPVTHSADLAMINQYIYGGQRNFSSTQGYRVLVVGCGTAPWFALAQQLAAATTKAEIVCQDISKETLSAARNKARAVKFLSNLFANVNFVFTQRSLEGTGHQQEFGQFDFIHCVGVLQHVSDPPASLRILGSLLRTDGGMLLSVSGYYGNVAKHAMQDVAAQLAKASGTGLHDPNNVRLMRELATSFPEHDAFVDHPSMSDATLVHKFMHAKDYSFTVTQLLDMIDAANLRATSFYNPILYDPATYNLPKEVKAHTSSMDERQKAIFTEHLVGNMAKHTLYIVKSPNLVELPQINSALMIPILAAGCSHVEASKTLPAEFMYTHQGLQYEVSFPQRARTVINYFDGMHRISDIVGAICKTDESTKGCTNEVLQTARALLKMRKLAMSKVQFPQTVFFVDNPQCMWYGDLD